MQDVWANVIGRSLHGVIRARESSAGVELLGTADFEERDRLAAETITLEAEWVEVRQLVVSATAPGGRPSRRDAVRTAQRNKD